MQEKNLEVLDIPHGEIVDMNGSEKNKLYCPKKGMHGRKLFCLTTLLLLIITIVGTMLALEGKNTTNGEKGLFSQFANLLKK